MLKIHYLLQMWQTTSNHKSTVHVRSNQPRSDSLELLRLWSAREYGDNLRLRSSILQ